MPIVSFNDKELLRGKVIEPGWYVMNIISVGEAPSKDGNSTNFPVEGVIVKNADNGSEAFAGTPVDWMFNSKAMGFSVGFLQGLGVEVEANKRYDLAMAAGRQLEVYIENDTYQGRMVNRVPHKYRALRQS